MANRRTLKRNINLVCEEIFAECMALSLYGRNRDGGQALFMSIVRMRNEYIRRVSHAEPGKKPKEYFRNLRDSFVAQADEIIDQINHLA